MKEWIYEYGDELTSFGVGLFKTTDFYMNVTADIHAKLVEVNKCHTNLQVELQQFYEAEMQSQPVKSHKMMCKLFNLNLKLILILSFVFNLSIK